MNFPNEQNDSLDDLLGSPAGEVRVEPIRAPANYKPKTFSENCPKCGGDGHYHAPSNRGNRCFMCDGKGKLTFKTSPEARTKAKTSAANRKAKKANEAAQIRAEAVEAWSKANPEVFAELVAGVSRDNGFCISLMSKLNQWGSLTDGQVTAVLNGKQKRAQAEAERAAREAAAPAADTAGIDRLKLAFDTAIANAKAKGRGLKMPRITIGAVVISPAKATSSNPGAIYVKEAGEYLGKIKDGRFYGVRACTPEQEKRVLAFIADPKAAAQAYGIETGVCCICNATLTNKASIEIGIGPICATKFGW